MPYKSNRELPKTVKDAIPSGKGRTIFRSVVNSQLDAGKSESVSFASAWAALDRAGYSKDDSGKWKLAKKSKLDIELEKALKTRFKDVVCYNSEKNHQVENSDLDIEKRQLSDDQFTTDIEAVARSVDLGFGGEIHVHQTSDGQATYMPGASHDEYLQRFEELAEVGEDKPKVIEISIVVKSDGEILKRDDEQRIVYGWASVIEKDGEPVIDRQGHMIEESELVAAVHEFVSESREGKIMHEGGQTSRIVDSIVLTKDLQKAMGINLGQVGWMVGVKVDNDEVWEMSKRGELPMFSIGGSGMLEDIDD